MKTKEVADSIMNILTNNTRVKSIFSNMGLNSTSYHQRAKQQELFRLDELDLMLKNVPPTLIDSLLDSISQTEITPNNHIKIQDIFSVTDRLKIPRDQVVKTLLDQP